MAVLVSWCGQCVSQQHRISLTEAHALAVQEPGAKPLPDSGPFRGMTHTAWTQSDGAPGGISSLAQTTEGYLWIGSSLGLYRFDGIHFASYPFSHEQTALPTQDVASVAADPNGGLWVGLRMTAVLHILEDGSTVTYTRNSGLTSDTLDRIAVKKDGSVWVLAGGKLLTLTNTTWVDFGRSHGLGEGNVFSIYFDREGTLWAAQDHRVMALPAGEKLFQPTPASVFFVSAMVESRSSGLLMADAWRSVKALGASPGNVVSKLQGRAELLVDRQENLWIAEDYFGLSKVSTGAWRRPRDRRIEHATSSLSVTSPQIGGMLEDRDGAIWVGTVRGLDRYERTSFEHFRAATLNFYPSVIGATDGSVWINSHGEPLMRWYRDKLTTFGKFVTYGPFATRHNGEICFVDARANELQCYGSEGATYALLDKRIEYAPALAMVEDRDGSLLVSFENKGVWRYTGSWQQVVFPIPVPSAPLCMLLDGKGRLWMGFQGAEIAVRSGEQYQIFTAGPEKWDNTLTLYEAAGTVWAAGASGLAYFNGKQLQQVHSTEESIFKGTSGIALDRLGNLWLNSGAGALRIRSASVNQLLHHATYLTDVAVYDERDGLSGIPTQLKPTPSLIEDAQGMLWFATAGDLVRVDPRMFDDEDNHQFSVLVEKLTLDGRPIFPEPAKGHVLQARPSDRHSLEVNYLALSLSGPARMTYRYRLRGDDPAWQEVGSRRQAFYTRLKPGQYIFEVSARRGQGPWVPSKEAIRIEVLPTFYETVWFKTALVLCLALLMRVGYMIHLRRVTHQLRLLAEERSRERIKIARDLHDTLLQGLHGLMLRFHFAAAKVTDSRERARLEEALSMADKILIEGRERVRHLRTVQVPQADVAEALTLVGTTLKGEADVDFRVDVEGHSRRLRPALQDEVFCIAREALTNAFLHSCAAAVSLNIYYGDRHLKVVCRDNGRGIDLHKAQDGSGGHWGIQGMRERSAHIGGRLEIRTAPSQGTAVTLSVPSVLAYEKRDGRQAGPEKGS